MCNDTTTCTVAKTQYQVMTRATKANCANFHFSIIAQTTNTNETVYCCSRKTDKHDRRLMFLSMAVDQSLQPEGKQSKSLLCSLHHRNKCQTSAGHT